MRSLWIVIRHEIQVTLGQPSYWLVTLGLPAIMLVAYGILMVSVQSEMDKMVAKVSTIQHAGVKPAGLVDQSGIIRRIPPSISSEALRQFNDLAAGQQALAAGEIDPLVLIPADYAESRDLEITMQDYNALGGMQTDLVQYLVAYNLAGDEGLARRITDPTAGEEIHYLAEKPGEQVGMLRRMAPLAAALLFLWVLTVGSSWMLHSVSREKVNRTAEVLLLSLDPRQLMVGKIIGLSAAAFVQLFFWLGGSMLFGRGAALVSAGAGLQLPVSFLFLGLAYFTLGYLLYAALLGAVGALAPNQHDDGNLSNLVIVPLMAPLFTFPAFISAPDGLLPTILSLFPLTAPTAMPARLAASHVPVWQIAVSLILLALGTAWVVNISARAFRADVLLSQSQIGVRWLLKRIRWPGRRLR